MTAGPATREEIGALATVSEAPPWESEQRERPTWGLTQGDAIAPGRTVLRHLGGGRRYEVFLVWDEHRLAVLVAKLLRPDHATDATALRELADEAAALARLSHPVLVRGFDVVPGGRFPHLLIEHLEGPTLRELIEGARSAAARAAAAARPPRRLGAALPGRRGDGPSRRQARQRGDGSAAAADRPQRRPHAGGGAAAAPAGRHRRLHGAGAVRPVAWRGRAAGGCVRAGGDAAPRGDGRAAVRAGRAARFRNWSAMRRLCRGGCLGSWRRCWARLWRGMRGRGRVPPSSRRGWSRWWLRRPRRFVLSRRGWRRR